MEWRSYFKRKPKKPLTKFQDWRNSIVFAVVVATLIRWSTVEAFVVPTASMENTVLVGDYLFVSKFHYGSRTPRTPLQIPLTHQHIWGTKIPSYLDWIELPSYRLPGISTIKREDVVVFNLPVNDINDNQNELRPIDLKTYYVKRCVAVGGDVLRVQDRQVLVNNSPLKNPPSLKKSYLVVSQDKISERNLVRLELDKEDYFNLGQTNNGNVVYRMLLTEPQAKTLKGLSYIQSIDEQIKEASLAEPGIFPQYKTALWNEDNYGPVTVPAKGMTISINDSTLALYGKVIKDYEHNDDVQINKNALSIGGKNISSYTFRQNYYFMMGDNRNNSWDSRFWGFVPEDHIVGKPLFIWFSLDSERTIFNKVRWNRIFSRIN